MRELLLALLVACSSEPMNPARPAPVAPRATTSVVVLPVASAVASATGIAAPASYGLTGKADLPAIGGVQEIVVQPDGKLLVVGDKGIVRVSADLAIDKHFGEAGVVRLAGEHASLHRTAIDAEGRIVVAADGIDKNAQDMLLVRLLPSGKVDESFGSAGRVVLQRSGVDSRPSAIFARGEDVVVIGNYQQGKNGAHYRQYLARFDALGKEKQLTFFDCIPASREFVTRARADGDGWLLAGYAINSGAADSGMFVARLRSDGTLDPAYGTKGVTWHRTRALDRAVAWVLVPMMNGDILVGGEAGPGDEVGMGRGYLARFDKQGNIVASWGDAGVAWAEPGSKWLSFVAALGEELIAVERFKPGLVTISAKGEASPTRTFEETGRYDEGVLLSNGDLVVAGSGLRRFEPVR